MSFQIKVEFEQSLRRISIPAGADFAVLRKTVKSLLDIEGNFDIKYRDEEGDLITLGSNNELAFLVDDSKQAGRVLRLIVERSTVPSSSSSSEEASAADANGHATSAPEAEAAPEPPKEPEIPLADVAKALADPAVVEQVLRLVSSPMIVETISNAAKAYLESKGDVELPVQLLLSQVPSVLELFTDLIEQVPELKKAKESVLEQQQDGQSMPFPFASNGFAPRPEMMMFMLPKFMMMMNGGGPCGPRGGRRCGPCGPRRAPWHGHGGGQHNNPCAPPQAEGQPPASACGPARHFGVFCDGCSLESELKQQSIRANHTGQRGMIRGERWKSSSLDDFDLCQTCKNSGKFPDEAYGPFFQVEPRAPRCGPFAAGGGRGGPQCHRGGGPGRWQQRQAAEKAGAFAAAAKAREAAELKKEEQEVPTQVGVAEAVRAESPSQEWVPVAPAATDAAAGVNDPFTKWSEQLATLESLGFTKAETYIEFLEQEQGNLTAVINRIVRRDL